jgi:hypothetical protein
MCVETAQEAGMQAQARTLEPEASASAAGDALRESGCRALVPLRSVDADRPRSAGRYPAAPFLAHLIAVDRRMPQMRARGRAAPQDAAAVYSAVSSKTPARTGRMLRRAV